MKIPVSLIDAIKDGFEPVIARFLTDTKRIESPEQLRSKRWLTRSVVPHIERLSDLFNRIDHESQGDSLERYWHQGSNPEHLRLAYFLYFMPANLFRAASVAAELSRLGFRFNRQTDRPLRGIDFGAGPASLSSGFAYAERFAPIGLGDDFSWALIEQDRKILDLGVEWSRALFDTLQLSNWETRPFHRKVEFSRPLLPKTAPSFDLWTHSFFSNESSASPNVIADQLIQAWDRHLSDDGIAILIEPALKSHSRKLLELRKALIEKTQDSRELPLKVLLPCLGEQACGALAEKEDWCHEEAAWFRPGYYRLLDELARLDRKTLPFSYLVVAKTRKPIEEILPALKETKAQQRYRLVSPAHAEGKDLEFFVCGQEGKRRIRHRPSDALREEGSLQRGAIAVDAELQGDRHSSIFIRTSRFRVI